MMKSNKTIFLIILLAMAISFYISRDYFSLTFIKENYSILQKLYSSNSFTFISIYFLTYIITTALSIPGATILTLLGSSLFGFTKGLIIISFASSIGATLSFLISRYFLRNFILYKFPEKMRVIDEGISNDGASYLLSLRLLPIFPFFLINLLMGLTSISLSKYYIYSQLGMLLGTIIYVNAGVNLAKISSISDIMNIKILISFILLGLLPIMSKYILRVIKKAL